MRWILLIPLVCLAMYASADKMSGEYMNEVTKNYFEDMDEKPGPTTLSDSEEEDREKSRRMAKMLGLKEDDDLLNTDGDDSTERNRKKAIIKGMFEDYMNDMFAPPEPKDNDTCKSYSVCTASGDPHFRTFDKFYYDFQGRCKYELVTTNCVGQTLKKGLKHFSIQEKQERRAGVYNADAVSFIRYLELNYKGNVYRLHNRGNQAFNITINGIQQRELFTGEVNAQLLSGKIVLSVDAGIKILWDGNHATEVRLCDTYKNQVCGLCGNFDGDANNELEDRDGKQVAPEGNAANTKYFSWGSKWRVFDDASDRDPKCNSPDATPDPPPALVCKKESQYKSKCELMKSTSSGPWAASIKDEDSKVIDTFVSSCMTDACLVEDDATKLKNSICDSYDAFSQYLINQGNELSWRKATGCEMSCGANETYSEEPQCILSCQFKEGLENANTNKCRPENIHGCYCKNKYYRNKFGACVLEGNCDKTAGQISSTIVKTIKNDPSPVVSVLVTTAAPTTKTTTTTTKAPTTTTTTKAPTTTTTTKAPTTTTTTKAPTTTTTTKAPTTTTTKAPTTTPTTIPTTTTTKAPTTTTTKAPTTTPTTIPTTTTTKAPTTTTTKAPTTTTTKAPTTTTTPGPRPAPTTTTTPRPVPSTTTKAPTPVPVTVSQIINDNCRNFSVCTASGDPHFLTFDKLKYDFQEKCKYDLVTTNCAGKTLPPNLKAFSIQEKQEKRGKSDVVSYIRYLQFNYQGQEYRLNQKGKEPFNISINGVPQRQLFAGEVTAQLVSGRVVLSIPGLRISWDGNHATEIRLCDTYRNYVCGLCGNFDGNANNDLQDRQGKSVATVGKDKATMHQPFGSKWRVFDDASDADQKCNDPNTTPDVPPPQECDKQVKYKSRCDLIASPNGPWGAQLSGLDQKTIKSYVDDCMEDACAVEDDDDKIDDEVCSAYEDFNELFLIRGMVINWRLKTKCPMDCGTNETYVEGSQCIKSCQFRNGRISSLTNACVEDVIQGCMCKDNYYKNKFGACVLEANCDKTDGQLEPDVIVTIRNNTSTVPTTPTTESPEGTEPIVFSLPPFTVAVDPPVTRPIVVASLPPVTAVTGPIVASLPPVDPEITDLEEHISHFRCKAYKTCFGYGDPHYRTFDGQTIDIERSCPYILATDKCNLNKEASFTIIVDHETSPTNSKLLTIKSVTVRYLNSTYTFTNGLSVNGVPTKIPHYTADKKVQIYESGLYMIMDTGSFSLLFDGVQLLKFNQCAPEICGLCGNHNNDPNDDADFEEYLVRDPRRNCFPEEVFNYGA